MGKSTAAALLAEMGLPVWDADAAVHRLYAPGGAAVEAIRALHHAAIRDGGVDRIALAEWIAADPAALRLIEAAVHPLVAADRARFLRAAADGGGADIAVLDIPLLFETGADAAMHVTLVVTAPPEVQRARVLARPGMTPDRLAAILARQMPDVEKRARADHVVEMVARDAARATLRATVARIRKKHGHA